MRKPIQFSLRRLFVATTLIAVGFASLADVRTAGQSATPMSVFNVIEGFVSFPLIGAGLITPVKRPILGACLGLLCLPALLWCLAMVTGAMSA